MILCALLQLGACVRVCVWFKLICTDEKIKIYYLHSISGGMLGICSVLMLHNTTYLFIYLVKKIILGKFLEKAVFCASFLVSYLVFSLPFLPSYYAVQIR